MTNTKYGPVLTYKDVDKAERLIGKKVLASDNLSYIEQAQNSAIILMDVREESDCPFITEKGLRWQFIREVIEEPSLMTNRQLAEWLAKGNGQAKSKDEDTVRAVPCSHWNYIADEDSDPVDEVVVIRSWDSDAWLTPTLEIYERDCKKEAK